MTLKQWLVDTLEKAGTTFIEAAIVYVIASQNWDTEFWHGLVIALIIALANVVKQALTFWVPLIKDWRIDIMYRTVSTFLVAVCGSLAAVQWTDLISVGFWKGTLLAGAVAGLAAFKGVLARPQQGTITPASFAQDPG